MKTPKPAAIDRATLDELLGFRLRRVQIRLARDFSAVTTDHGLRSGEYTALAVIASHPGVSQNEICKATGLDKSAAVAVIDGLHERKWITRRRSDQDRRRYVLTISAAGRRALADLVGRTRHIEEPVLSALSARERAQLFALLDKLVERVLADQA